jgi:hypothetical protein
MDTKAYKTSIIWNTTVSISKQCEILHQDVAHIPNAIFVIYISHGLYFVHCVYKSIISKLIMLLTLLLEFHILLLHIFHTEQVSSKNGHLNVLY